MDEQNGNETGELPFGVKKCGWMFRFIQEGWLKKRWRKRWCLLKHEALYIFEYETFDHSDDQGCEVKLEQFEECINATKKESKKKFTLVLVPEKRKQSNGEKSSKKKVSKEMLYVENDAELQSWIKALSETIAFAHMDATEKAKAQEPQRAKVAAKPKGKKPPTRQHRRKKAAESKLLLETSLEADTPPQELKKRANEGKRPVSALMPKKSRKLSASKRADTPTSSILLPPGHVTSSTTDKLDTNPDPMEIEDQGSSSIADSLSTSFEDILHIKDNESANKETAVSFTPDQTDRPISIHHKEVDSKKPSPPSTKPQNSLSADQLIDQNEIKDMAVDENTPSETPSDSLPEDVTNETICEPNTTSVGKMDTTESNANGNCNSGLIVEILEDVGFIRTEL